MVENNTKHMYGFYDFANLWGNDPVLMKAESASFTLFTRRKISLVIEFCDLQLFYQIFLWGIFFCRMAIHQLGVYA